MKPNINVPLFGMGFTTLLIMFYGKPDIADGIVAVLFAIAKKIGG
jgi:hypothetical protein